MTQLKAIIAAGTLTGIILVTAIAFGVRSVNALGSQNAGGTTSTAPTTIIQSEPGQPIFSRQSQQFFGEREHEEYEEWDDD